MSGTGIEKIGQMVSAQGSGKIGAYRLSCERQDRASNWTSVGSGLERLKTLMAGAMGLESVFQR